MCGPADYHALYACILRIVALSVAGLFAYAVRMVVHLFQRLARTGTGRAGARAAH